MTTLQGLFDLFQTPLLLCIIYQLGAFHSRWENHETRIKQLEKKTA